MSVRFRHSNPTRLLRSTISYPFVPIATASCTASNRGQQWKNCATLSSANEMVDLLLMPELPEVEMLARDLRAPVAARGRPT